MTELQARPALADSRFPSTVEPFRPRLPDATHALNTWAEIDLQALEGNVRAMQAAIGQDVEIIAVVKANAYGAGVEGMAPALRRAGVGRFAVISVAEGVAVRRLDPDLPILVLGHSFPEDADSAVAHRLTLTCHTLALGRALSGAASAAGSTAAVHLHVDTGLHREGLRWEDALALAGALRALPRLTVEGLSTHMANADEPDDSFSAQQAGEFDAIQAALDWIPYRHTANTATALRRSHLRFDGVRLGLALHGVLPENTPGPALRPILSLKARVARTWELAPGDGVAYGLTWRASSPARVALVPLGYADGWRRNLGNRGEVLIGGHRSPMVGRVMMDQFLADVTAVPAPVAEGDEVVLIGEQGGQRIAADDVATRVDTIPWDILASLQARIPRLFHRGGILEP